MDRVGATAKQLGRDITLPGVAANDAAEAMSLLLSRAGLNVDDAVTAARGALQLATAAQITNTEAVKLTASALNAFGLAGNQATHVADVLTNAANASQGEITDMGIALQQAAAVARQAGISLEDTTAMLSLLAKNGIAGSDAGTSLRVALTRLQAPTKKATAELERLGVTVRDGAGNVRPEVFNDIVKALERTGGATQKARSLFVIFGQDAQRAASVLGARASVGWSGCGMRSDQTGSAAELAAARMTGLRGAGENLKNQLSALGLSLGESLTPALAGITTAAAEAVSGINTLSSHRLAGCGRTPASRSSLRSRSSLTLVVREAATKNFKDRAAGFVDDFFSTLPRTGRGSYRRGREVPRSARCGGGCLRASHGHECPPNHHRRSQ